ncbi:hypothetical protein ABPG72_019309 [Tetrahymena utriculariae]
MSKPDRSQILNLLYNVMEFEKKKDPQSENKLLHQERLILLCTDYLSAGLGYADIPFNFSDQFIDYALSINKIAMEHFNSNNNEKAIHFLLKAIDILMHKSIHKFVKPVIKYGEMKVLTFNNLGCIYQKRKQYVLALKAVHFALELEERLVQDNNFNAKNSIISTLFNKAAIQSNLNKHNKAQDSLNKALYYTEKLLKELQQENQQDQQETSKLQENQNEKEQEEESLKAKNPSKSQMSQKEIEDKLLELNKLKMMCFYNLGAEDEHLYHQDRALLQYQKAKQIAEEINDLNMRDRINKIISQLK